MEFEMVHIVHIPHAEYFEVVLSDAFNAWVKKTMKHDERKVTRFEEIDGVLHRSVRTERVLNEKAQKHFKVPRMVVEEHQQIRREQGLTNWEYVPNIGASRFSAKGTSQVRPHPQGVELTIRGEVTFRIPLIGKRIEKHTVAWVKDNFHKLTGALEGYYRKVHQAAK
jgi:hypothetical protein